MANSNLNRDGKTIYVRLCKALETCHKKYGDHAHHAINGILHRQFGDINVNTLREIVRKGEFWKLAIQTQRAQHMRVVEGQAMVKQFDLLVGASTENATTKTSTENTTDVAY